MLGLVQHVYMTARGEFVRVTLGMRMDLSVGLGWTKWALDRGSGGSGLPNPHCSSDCWGLRAELHLGWFSVTERDGQYRVWASVDRADSAG